ncbi:MAG: hypothetical protein HUJ68_04795 [Clostridia bacterium]|nr:hypothetical protein [Clostridia bacterium]
MDKYRDVPVISADDDCLYNCNYAEELYNAWYKNKICIHTIYACKVSGYQHGPATLYPPFAFGEIAIKSLNTKILETNHDDVYYGMLAKYIEIKIINIHNKRPYIFHDTIKGLSDSNSYNLTAAQKIIKKVLYENK